MSTEQQRLSAKIDAVLPQTQCQRCGYDACRPYAEAIANGEAAINRCPPGGADGIRRLSQLLGAKPLDLDPDCGTEKEQETVAVIVEADCIGCTKCIQACPVDAIVGAMNFMHMVIANECNGCELCIAPCPVDCITMEIAADQSPAISKADHYRARFESRKARLISVNQARKQQRQKMKQARRGLSPVEAALAGARKSDPSK